MTRWNAQFNDIWLKIEIQVKTEEKKRQLERKICKKIDKRKFTELDFKSQVKMQNLMMDFTKFHWRCKSEKNKRRTIFKTENLTISQEKIHWIGIQMTGRNAEFNRDFNWIRLKIEIEAKVEEKKHLEEKICHK